MLSLKEKKYFLIRVQLRGPRGAHEARRGAIGVSVPGSTMRATDRPRLSQRLQRSGFCAEKNQIVAKPSQLDRIYRAKARMQADSSFACSSLLAFFLFHARREV
jgi:hypothetical protein